MKTYFEKLSKIGVEAVQGLRQLDAQHVDENIRLYEDVKKGNITPTGYERRLKELDKVRDNYIAGYAARIDALKAEFAEASERHTTPTSGNLNMADMEILKNFELSPKEFEGLARKYDNNATMGRMLEKYRVDHNVKTDWRFQTADRRNEIFNSACDSVYFTMKQSDNYSPAREANIERSTATAYHKLQGSIAEVMPIPDDPTPAPGTVIAQDNTTGTVTVTSQLGGVTTIF